MELDIPSISAIVAAVGVLVGVALTVIELRNLVKQRQTDLIMKLYSEWQSKELSDATLTVWNLEFKDYDDFVKKYGRWYSETEVYSAFRTICLFFDEIGILALQKLVDIEMISNIFLMPITTTWEKVRLLIEGGRRQLNPYIFRDFEYLYNEVKRREPQLLAERCQ